MTSPLAANKRLERLLSTATVVRQKYQARLADAKKIQDKDYIRSLTNDETALVHNEWMHDVADWMNEECLMQYNQLMAEASIKKRCHLPCCRYFKELSICNRSHSI